jgi:ABC-type multidrug transport system, ATPase component
MSALTLKNVNYSVKGFSLDNVSFEVPKGMITGLVGRNGSGKTTLIHILANNINRKSGTILYDGKLYWEDEVGIKRKLGFVYDEPSFNDGYTPMRFLTRALSCFDDFDPELFKEYMNKFDLPYYKRISKFSLGMKHKFWLIATLSRRPQILIMDEPTTGVDPADRSVILDILQEYVENEQNSVLLSTHITGDLDQIADYLVFIDAGRIVMADYKESLLEQFRVVELPLSFPIDTYKNNVLSLKKTSLGMTALTNDNTIWQLEGISSRIPTIEDLAIHLREIHKNMDKHVDDKEAKVI